MVPSDAISIGVGSSQSRRSGAQAGRSYGTSTKGTGRERDRGVQVGEEAEPVRPGVRRPRPPVQIGQRGDPATAADPTHEQHVGLDHVDLTADDEVTGLVLLANQLAGRQPHRGSPPQRRVAVGVLRAQRLLEPVDPELLELARALRGGRDIPARLAVARHAPALVGVDHDLEAIADRLAHGPHDLDVRPPVAVVEADLHRSDAGLDERDAPLGALLRGDELPARGVGQQALAPTAEQLPERLPEGLARRDPRPRSRPPTAGRRAGRSSRTPRGRPRSAGDRDRRGAARAPHGRGSRRHPRRCPSGRRRCGRGPGSPPAGCAGSDPRPRGTGARAGSGTPGSRRR